MIWEDDFLCLISDHFSKMRLLAEGAIKLFEDDTCCLIRLARDAKEHDALTAINDIGTALYEFRRHVKLLQEAHSKEVQQVSQNPIK